MAGVTDGVTGMSRIMPQAPAPAPAAESAAVADGPEPIALIRSVPFAEGRFFVLADEAGRPLAVLPDLSAAHRIARLFGFAAHTVH